MSKKYTGKFLPFISLGGNKYRVIVLVSQDFPPDHGGGIGTFTKDLAEALAAQGNIVHVLTKSPDINRVDFESGVWVHRLIVNEVEYSIEASAQNVPQHIWNWSATALEETRRIATHRNIDVVEAPIWDCEGIAFLYHRQWPLVTSLHTTLKFWLESNRKYRVDTNWMKSFGAPVLSLEKELMSEADAVRANSHAIIQEIEKKYAFKFVAPRIRVVPHGMSDIGAKDRVVAVRNKKLQVLFVGRLERRKGIDVLLEAIPKVLQRSPNIEFRIVGNYTLPDTDGKTYKELFLAEHSGSPWLSSVTFEGRVSDDVLYDAYESCDIFVAPSRFESFGLIFLEAMRAGKPVIGCLAGGMPEVVTQNVNGLLVEPGDADALLKAILHLIEDGELRRRMGKAGRKIFEEKFTSERMARASDNLYVIAENNHLTDLEQ